MSTPAPTRPLLPSTDSLLRELLLDLSPASGLQWMRGDEAVVLLVSDYLLSALDSCMTSYREACWHLTEVERLMADKDKRAFTAARKAGAVTLDRLFNSPGEQALTVRRDAHLAGFFRAFGSVMDTTAIYVCALTGFPRSIIYKFTSPLFISDVATHGCLTRNDTFGLREGLADAIANAGSIGWSTWASEMRNALVHRPRPMWVEYLDVQRDHTNRAVSARKRLYLPQHPEWSDVEMWRDIEVMTDVFLPGFAQETLNSLLLSLKQYVESMSLFCQPVVAQRRADPNLVHQPVGQWRPSARPKVGAQHFAGSGAVTVPLVGNALVVSEMTKRRMSAAAVLPAPARAKWAVWLATLERALEAARPKRKRCP